MLYSDFYFLFFSNFLMLNIWLASQEGFKLELHGDRLLVSRSYLISNKTSFFKC
jgi:hypothetical protein